MPILQINFKLNVPADEYEKICEPLAQRVADVPGLRWKLWLLNKGEQEAGGVYLFDTEEALNEYMAGPIVTQVKSHPALRDLSAVHLTIIGLLFSETSRRRRGTDRGELTTSGARYREIRRAG